MPWLASVSNNEVCKIAGPCVALFLGGQRSPCLQADEQVTDFVWVVGGHLNNEEFALEQACPVVWRKFIKFLSNPRWLICCTEWNNDSGTRFLCIWQGEFILPITDNRSESLLSVNQPCGVFNSSCVVVCSGLKMNVKKRNLITAQKGINESLLLR